MLTADTSNLPKNNAELQTQYLKSSAQNVPSTAQAAFTGLAQGFSAPFMALQAVGNMLKTNPVNVEQFRNVESYFSGEQQQERSGSDEAANVIGQLAGSIFNPINLLGGDLVGDAASTATRGILARTAPMLENQTTARAVLQTGLPSLTRGGGLLAGGMFPQDILENYNATNNTLDWQDTAKDVGINFGIGMAIPAIPFAAGLVKARIADNTAKKLQLSELDNALENGEITPEQHDFQRSYINGANPDILLEKAKNVIQNLDDNITVSNGHVPLSLLTPEDIQNWHGAMADQMASNLGDDLNDSFSHFITQRALYKIVSNRNLMDGLQGWVDHMDLKLGDQAENIDKIVKAAQSIKKSVKNLPLPNELKFKSILDNYEKTAGAKTTDVDLASYDTTELPLTSEMRDILLARRQRASGRISGDIPPVTYPTLPQEINSLEAEFEADNYQLTKQTAPEYTRLRQLANYHKSALKLLKKVDLHNLMHRQNFYKAMANKLLDYANSPIGSLARENKLPQYVHARIAQNIEGIHDEPIPEIKTPEPGQVESASVESAEQAIETLPKNAITDDLRQQASEALDQFKSLKAKLKSAGNDLITCVQGVLGNG